jgi:hypothetical protein
MYPSELSLLQHEKLKSTNVILKVEIPVLSMENIELVVLILVKLLFSNKRTLIFGLVIANILPFKKISSDVDFIIQFLIVMSEFVK